MATRSEGAGVCFVRQENRKRGDPKGRSRLSHERLRGGAQKKKRVPKRKFKQRIPPLAKGEKKKKKGKKEKSWGKRGRWKVESMRRKRGLF